MAREIAEGTNNLFKLVRDHGVTGVAGRLIDLIKCPQQLYRAVEVTAGECDTHTHTHIHCHVKPIPRRGKSRVAHITSKRTRDQRRVHIVLQVGLACVCVCVSAGNSMFHVVVDSDDVALRCTRLLQQHKAGRVTFMPLNTLHLQQASVTDHRL